MIGQHFDYVWSYIKDITEINNHHNKRGISKDLVYFQLKALGIDTFDQFENANLIEYILGEGLRDHTVGTLEIGEWIVGQSNKFYNEKPSPGFSSISVIRATGIKSFILFFP